jgi:ferric-dicitrate binding protein FerR (iron transport regulator)
MNAGNDRSIENLIRLAGGREMPSAEAVERAHAAAERSWQLGLAPTPRRSWVAGRGKALLACAATAGVVVLMLLVTHRAPPPQAPRVPQLVARVATLQGVVAMDDDVAARPLSRAAEVRSGDRLTTAEGRVATAFSGGLSLRLDRHTRVRFDGPDRVTLLEGTLYVDSGGLNAGPPLVVATPAGEVTHVGTQFLVSVSIDATSVRVREGQVVLAPATGDASTTVAAGDELEIRGGRQSMRHGAPAFGAPWDWLASVAPTIPIEGRPMSEFLAWLARERGWQLRYADAAIQRRSREIRLHGSLDGLDTAGMLERVGLVTGFELVARDGVLSVETRR